MIRRFLQIVLIIPIGGMLISEFIIRLSISPFVYIIANIPIGDFVEPSISITIRDQFYD